jgi:hypothetical protein
VYIGVQIILLCRATMRLLRTDNLEFASFESAERPPYAILSHRWTNDEVLFEDMKGDYREEKPGFHKVKEFARLAARHGYRYCWIDTCCTSNYIALNLLQCCLSVARTTTSKYIQVSTSAAVPSLRRPLIPCTSGTSSPPSATLTSPTFQGSHISRASGLTEAGRCKNCWHHETSTFTTRLGLVSGLVIAIRYRG